MNRARIEQLVRELLEELGAPLEATGLLRTPARVATSIETLTAGYRAAVDRRLETATVTRTPAGLHLARGIELMSLCEHHLLPFFGSCHIAVLAPERPFALAELGGIVETHARRLQLQERLTDEIARAVAAGWKPRGVAVAVEARHLCMMMRGVGKQNSIVSTSSAQGALREPANRAEFLSLAMRGNRR